MTNSRRKEGSKEKDRIVDLFESNESKFLNHELNSPVNTRKVTTELSRSFEFRRQHRKYVQSKCCQLETADALISYSLLNHLSIGPFQTKSRFVCEFPEPIELNYT